MLTTIGSSLDILSTLPFFYYPFVLVMGLVVGSFLNVVILRVPKILENSFRRDCCEFLEIQGNELEAVSLAHPPSTCPSCGSKIKPWHNIPLLSYLLLKGKCAHCANKIGIRYPLVELTTALLSVFTIYYFGFTAEGLLGLLLLWFLIALTVIDVDTQLLPDNLTLSLLWLGLLINGFSVFTDPISAIWGAIAGYMSLWLVFWLFKWVTGKEGMGYGDFKLLAALGAWMGWQFLPLIVVLSSFVGALLGIVGILLMKRDKNNPIPFGPYLATAGWIAFLWGDQIIDYYFQILLV